MSSSVYVSGLMEPVGFEQHPSNPSLQYVVEQRGVVRVIVKGVLQAGAFLDISSSVLFSGERGLLGLAFPPDYEATRRFYVHFTNASGHTVVSRFNRSIADPLVADAASRFDFVWPDGRAFIEQPFSNHKGGQIAFGPDGYLYIALGDGGSSNDPMHNAQNPQTLLGKLLRIDVNVPDGDAHGYTVPVDNPFVDGSPVTAMTEIWAFGLRNPWRFSFDVPALGGTGAILLGDVGQGSWEEIDYEPANSGGRNYGWRNREGSHDNVTSEPLAFEPATDPIFEYGRDDGQTVVGGFVYRGTALGAEFQGRYFFADYVQGRVWSLGLSVDHLTGEAVVTDRQEHTTQLSAMLGLISSLGQDLRGELYIVRYSEGDVLRILGPGGASGPFVPINHENSASYELLWHHDEDGWNVSWTMNGVDRTNGVLLDPSRITESGWRLVGSGDFNGDAQRDIVWQHESGVIVLWHMNGTDRIDGVVTNPGTVLPHWNIVAVADINEDTKPDFIFQHRTDGWLVVWYMNDAQRIGNELLNPERTPPEWRVRAAADFTGDGRADLIFQHETDGWLVIWEMHGSQRQSGFLLTPSRVLDPDWALSSVADINNDGSPDLIWQHREHGWLTVWRMNGPSRVDGATLIPGRIPDVNWRLAGPY
jgi:glucose/arabinose dehydrogenase